MRFIPALALPFVVVVLSAAPSGAPVGAPFSSQANALGGRFGAVGMGRPLGGIAPSAPHRGPGQGGRRNGGAPVYGYSWYVPGYLDSSSYAPEPGPPVEAPPPPPPQPIIINQYFTAPPQPQPQAEPQQTAAAAEPKYFLIAYKDHSIVPVLTYWVEDKTMHYVTTQNTHNQASIDLIDLDLMKTLNRGR